ncbi:MAG: cell division protein FtsL [Gammaproteobacteria bacterium]
MTSEIYAEKAPFLKTATLSLYKPNFATLCLGVMVMLSGLAVVYVADLNRRLFTELETAQGLQEELKVDWDKLLLEQSTWSCQGRIGEIARSQLGMQLPTGNQIVLIKAEP